MRILKGSLAAMMLATILAIHAQAAGTPCENLASLTLPNGSVTDAQLVAAGAFSPPGGDGNARAFSTLPAFCRVAATLKPSSDSDIKIEVWLPAAG
jgi:feruloyl esterase